jgi:hypothetical protein
MGKDAWRGMPRPMRPSRTLGSPPKPAAEGFCVNYVVVAVTSVCPSKCLPLR